MIVLNLSLVSLLIGCLLINFMCKKADEDKANLVDKKRQFQKYHQIRIIRERGERLASRPHWQPPRTAPISRRHRYRNRSINY